MLKHKKHHIYKTTILFFILVLAGMTAYSQVPEPSDVYGFEVGADYKLADYNQMLDYYDRLDRASNRVKKVTIGETVFGYDYAFQFR